MLTPDDLRGIADELRCNADALRDGHTLRGEWHDDDARREHDKLIRWADALNHPERDLDMVGLRCLADIRAAVGDSGQMMQSELVAHIAGLRADAERWRWAAPRATSYTLGNTMDTVWQVRCGVGASDTDMAAAIDAARAKEASDA